MHDLTKGLKAPNSAATWNRLLYLNDQVTQFNREKIREVVNAMVIESNMVEAIQKHKHVSERHTVTLRDAFNYLHHTYKAAVEYDQPDGDWTSVWHIRPLYRTVYIDIEEGDAAVESREVLLYGIPGCVAFEVPGPTKTLNTQRVKKWREVLNNSKSHFKLDVVTLDTFAGYASHATQSFIS